MRSKCLTIVAACTAGTLLGCVPGYNSMVFATKTNAALVVDTKTPEVMLDIGRQEGLLAPTFEAGKTPPVMASFRFDSDKGFLSNYIGSTFTTGDASVAMARLYNAGDWPAAKGDNAWKLNAKQWQDETDDYDSKVDLYLEPKMPWWVPKEDPGAVRPVLFGTDTAFGFKASWSGTQGAMPDFLRLGYQRRELAYAAVTIGPKLKEDSSGENPPEIQPGLEARVPSLLATVDAEVQAGKFLNSGFSYLQYFASGSAATSLALREAVRSAMLRRLDPEAANAAKKSEGPSGESEAAGIALISGLHTYLCELAKDEKAEESIRNEAERHCNALNGLSAQVPATYSFQGYQGSPPNYTKLPNIAPGKPVEGSNDFKRVATYLARLADTENKLSVMKEMPNATIDGQPPANADDGLKQTFIAERKKEFNDVKKLHEDFGKLIGTSSAVRNAVRFTNEQLAGKD